MDNIERNERFARMWKASREDAGWSQADIAKALGVSKTTVQNWEAGTSCPSQVKGFEWFETMGLQPLTYYYKYIIFPDELEDIENADDKEITDTLMHVVSSLPTNYKLKLLYMLSGEHGSSPAAIIELMNAHLQTPLRDRINIAQLVVTSYELANETHNTQNPDKIQPSIDTINYALKKSRIAVLASEKSYTAFPDVIKDAKGV